MFPMNGANWMRTLQSRDAVCTFMDWTHIDGLGWREGGFMRCHFRFKHNNLVLTCTFKSVLLLSAVLF